jgi:hypothetical protein
MIINRCEVANAQHSSFEIRIRFHLHTHVPLNYPDLTIFLSHLTLAMNLAIYPFAIHSRPIPQYQRPIPMLLVKFVVPLEKLSIFPLKLPIAMHHIVLPFSIVVSVVLVSEFALSL